MSMEDSSRITIYILTRDRPTYLREAVASAVAQRTALPYTLIISDNSDGDETSAMLRSEFASVEYIRRIPALSSLDHFRRVLEEARSDFLVLFHDDDVLHPDYLDRMITALAGQPDAAAVACDALLLVEGKSSGRSFMGRPRPRLIRNPRELISSYFGVQAERPAPFPSYVYRRAMIDGLHLDHHLGGKYSDVAFLAKLLGRGPILWLGESLMHYRLHGGNDSKTVDIKQQLKLFRFFKQLLHVGNSDPLIHEIRFVLYVRWLHASHVQARLSARKRLRILQFLLSNVPFSALYRRFVRSNDRHLELP